MNRVDRGSFASRTSGGRKGLVRRLVVSGVMIALIASLAPAFGDAQVDGCSSTTGLGVQRVAKAQCSFELQCFAPGCVYVYTLDVSGTGLVSGRMTVETIGAGGTARFVNGSTGRETTPTCGPTLFNCSSASTLENPVVLFVTVGEQATNVLIRVVCSGSGLAAVESVSCSIQD